MKFLIAAYSDKPYWDFPRARAEEVMRELSGLCNVAYVCDDPSYAREIVDSDAACVLKISADLLKSARQLRWLHTPAAGVGSLLIPELVESDIVLTNGRGTNAVTVAEHALGLMLALARRLADAARYQAQRLWATDLIFSAQPPLDELFGKTLLIVGFGSIGRETAKRARAFGMRVLATKRNPGQGERNGCEVYSPEALPRLLGEADFVLLSLPLTPDTGRVIGAKELELMKPSAFLINVARGRVVDEDALIEALERGRIAGAGLDVFRQEPLPESSPLWTMRNVIITPHYAGTSRQFWCRARDLLVENIRRFVAGQPLLNVVDKKRGY